MPPCRASKLAAPALAAALLAALPSAAANVDVTATIGLAFNPKNVTINVGDTVTWRNGGGQHNVLAADSSFRCANGCDDDGGDGTPATNDWVAVRTFNQPGTYPYYCQLHGTPSGFGMAGSVIVQGSTGGEEHGALRFSVASYSVNEGAGSATITVQRVGGDDGAVAVSFTAAAGTAAAVQDFTAVTGALSWADNDDNPKTFAVPIVNDSLDEPNETVNLSLSNPTGGATLGAPSAATLTIQDNDPPAGGGGSVAAPTNLQLETPSATEVRLTWTDNSNNETGFRIERRTVLGSFQEVGTVGPGVTTFTASGLQPSTFYLFRVRAAGSGDTFSGYSNEAGTATLGDIAPCVAGPQALCVNNGRFMIEVDWRTPDGSTGAGQAVPIPSAPDSGLFYFFSAANLEMLIKVLNACGLNNRYWVFFAATTNVEFAVVVTDTQTGRTKPYHNPLNRPAPPVQDVEAFATCP